MTSKLLKFSTACVIGVLSTSLLLTPAMATEHAIAGFTYDKTGIDISPTSKDLDISTLSSDSTPMPGFHNIGIADVTTNLLVRSKPSESGSILGKMPRHSGCEILEPSNDGWTKVVSGKVTGYVKSEYLITGEEASILAKEKANKLASFNGDGNLRVRKDPYIPKENEPDNVIDTIAPGEEILVLEDLVVTYGEDINKWVKVSLDGDDNDGGIVGYVAKQYVNISLKLPQAHTLEELDLGGASPEAAKIIKYAKEFLGYRYEWGGSGSYRLENNKGVDCSGFVQAVFAQYGYKLNRTSRDQAKQGTSVSSKNLKAGDLVFYGSKSYINHVAIYIGNGKIIHASNERDGIKISNAFYRTPVKCVRILR